VTLPSRCGGGTRTRNGTMRLGHWSRNEACGNEARGSTAGTGCRTRGDRTRARHPVAGRLHRDRSGPRQPGDQRRMRKSAATASSDTVSTPQPRFVLYRAGHAKASVTAAMLQKITGAGSGSAREDAWRGGIIHGIRQTVMHHMTVAMNTARLRDPLPPGFDVRLDETIRHPHPLNISPAIAARDSRPRAIPRHQREFR